MFIRQKNPFQMLVENHFYFKILKYRLSRGCRFSLILSKTESLIVDWSLVTVDDIDDEYCLVWSSNHLFNVIMPFLIILISPFLCRFPFKILFISFVFYELQDEYGNRIYRDGKPLIHTDGTGFISEDLASLCPKDLLKKEYISNEYIEVVILCFRSLLSLRWSIALANIY